MDYDTLWSGGGHCWSVSSHLCTGFAHRPWIPLSSGRSGGSEGVAGRWEAPPGWEAGWERPGGRLLEPWPPERRRWRRSWEGTGIHRSGWCTACLLYRHRPGAYTHRCLRTEGRGVKRKKIVGVSCCLTNESCTWCEPHRRPHLCTALWLGHTRIPRYTVKKHTVMKWLTFVCPTENESNSLPRTQNQKSSVFFLNMTPFVKMWSEKCYYWRLSRTR